MSTPQTHPLTNFQSFNYTADTPPNFLRTSSLVLNMNILTSTASSRELLSALADGELSPQELTEALQLCAQDASAEAHWASYQAIGDVLRSRSEAAGMADTAFLDRFRHRLAKGGLAASDVAASAVVLPTKAPLALVLPFKKPLPAGVAADSSPKRGDESANDPVFRWKLVAGFASLAAVSAIAWNAAGMLAPAGAPQLAQSAPAVQQVLVASPQGNFVRDARFEEFLAAHKQMAGSSALQVPSGFLRNATFEQPQNAGR